LEHFFAINFKFSNYYLIKVTLVNYYYFYYY